MSIAARFRHAYPGFTLDVDLELPGRGVTALFGHSGSGKTTLLRCIAGLERASGRLVIGGDTWQDDRQFVPTHRRPIGYVFQEASLFPHLSVRGNLDFGAKRCGRRPTSVDFLQIVELLGIAALLERKPDRLSGGERQRVAIARALLTAPRLLLMDEPLASLDLPRKNEILPYLERLHDSLEIPVLYVSHAPNEVARLADHIVVMDGGRAVAQGPLVDILARMDLPIRLGEDVGVVIEGRVTERDARWNLIRIAFDGGAVWSHDGGQAIGAPVRVRVFARDVSIVLEPQHDTSILNCLSAQVMEIADDTHPALALVRLHVGQSAVVARLTRRSVNALGLEPGMPVHAQIKTVALVE